MVGVAESVRHEGTQRWSVSLDPGLNIPQDWPFMGGLHKELRRPEIDPTSALIIINW